MILSPLLMANILVADSTDIEAFNTNPQNY